MPFDRFENELVSALAHLPTVANQQGFGDPDWTNWVKKTVATTTQAALAGILEISSAEISVLYTNQQGEQPRTAEWLNDLVCLHHDAKGQLREVLVALESEWNTRAPRINRAFRTQIREDFQKLLVIQARYRIMVYQQPTLQTLMRTFDELRQQIAAYRHTGETDRYLLVGFTWQEPWHWEFKLTIGTHTGPEWDDTRQVMA
jgi:hypothetical protein